VTMNVNESLANATAEDTAQAALLASQCPDTTYVPPLSCLEYAIFPLLRSLLPPFAQRCAVMVCGH
jgi:hypothetical protein